MIEDSRGCVDYAEAGVGPTIVLAPGSCSTGAAWRPIIDTWNGQFRCVTTSLLGYGQTAERRSENDTAISHEADALELVIRKADAPVHLVGHSFGGLVALVVALRNLVPLKSLTILEAPVADVLRENGDHEHYRAFRQMTDGYFADFANGNREAIAAMIDFYGGAGTFAAWPARYRSYAIETTAVNILDWRSAYAFPLKRAALGAIETPTLVLYGGASHPAARRANALLGESIRRADCIAVEGAAHFMIATHPDKVGQLIAGHVTRAEARR
jgi:pimeloyl-ACP methyl ester carboxylesterase